DEQLEHLAQRRLVVEAADRFWRGAVRYGFRDAEHDRRADTANFGAKVLLACFFDLPECEWTSEEAGKDVDDLSGGTRDHLVHAVGDDVAGAGEDSFGVGSTSDQSRDAAGFVDLNLLIALQRIFVTTDLGDDGVAQPKSLVPM